ncbi:hypothetical protein PRK78_006953 [Emydomyces testavorans]|uniref:EKC/KEOPS complex subunit BUD32 n=1 Tax=Emydomyces testavorans TaxID=2070801 RepID=A0AAF0DNH2_9EURO|nr:hypothetical protein PRK78_006953 [Emydomyces testavorans]
MIPPEWRFYVNEGVIYPNVSAIWDIIDWDTRRLLQVTGPPAPLPENEEALELLTRYLDKLGPDDHIIKVDENGDFVGVSSEDPTWEIRYPDYPGSLEDDSEDLICRSELTEIDRLAVCTDLVECNSTTTDGTTRKELVVFKYTIIEQRISNIWQELHILKALRGHDSFVPFHRVVIDDVTKQILGFTSQYIPGGSLEKYNQVFYFSWLKQLTDAVDDLNLHFGIMHQDVAPRNVLVDPATQSLKLFDFDRSAEIGGRGVRRGRNDVDAVIFTVYEALTKDQHFREIPFWEQDVSQVEALEEWELQLPLEDGKDIAAYRSYLNEWAVVRRTTKTIEHYSEATNPIPWPIYPEPQKLLVHDGSVSYTHRRRRRDVEAAGGYVTRWDRPPQQKKEGQSLN